MRYLLLLALVLAVGAAEAKPRAARCAIASDGQPAFRGPCLFAPERSGSFSVSAIGRRRLFPEIDIISVTIVRPGTAEVRGLTASGINSRWGSATRSRRDSACWDGEDFRICVY
jgi:hypothetical protein